jgi:hypothetical protein
VTEEKEEIVLKEAFGGFANVSAYCLVYLSDDEVKADKAYIEQAQGIIDEKEIPVERKYYSKFMNIKLIEEVEADNVAFHEEIEEYKFNTALKNIVDTYKERYDIIDKAVKADEPKKCSIKYDSFAHYLKSDVTFEGLFKWYTLDNVLRDSPLQLNLKQLKGTPKLKSLESRVNAISKPHAFNHLTLTDSEESKLEVKLVEYNTHLPSAYYTKLMIEAMFDERMMDFLYDVRCITEVHLILFVKPIG